MLPLLHNNHTSSQNGVSFPGQKQNTYTKKVAFITVAICLAVFSIIFLLAGYDYSCVIMLKNVSEVSGTLDEIYISDEGDISLYLEGDDEEYYIATELFDTVESKPSNQLRKGDKLSMTVGKSLMDTVYVIKLTKEGLTYIPIEIGHEHYYVESIILYILGAVCAVASAIFTLICVKKFKKSKKSDYKTDLFNAIYEEGDTILWHKALTAKDMIAMMYAPFGIIMLIYAAIGLGLWLTKGINLAGFAILFGVVAFLSAAILCGSVASPANRHIYVVTDKRILIASPAILLFLNFENIKEIRLKKSLFFKNKTTLRFIPNYKSSITYKFGLLENAEDIKRLILSRSANESKF